MGERKVKEKPRRGERAHIVREGIKADMTNDQIVAMVQERFPDEPRKRVQTLVSRYRQYLGFQVYG